MFFIFIGHNKLIKIIIATRRQDKKKGKFTGNAFPFIVRPTKKPTNFGPIRGVPKYGVGGGNRKKCFHGKVEVRDVKAAVDLHFLVFHVLVSFRVP
jgi:hypothetical protein